MKRYLVAVLLVAPALLAACAPVAAPVQPVLTGRQASPGAPQQAVAAVTPSPATRAPTPAAPSPTIITARQGVIAPGATAAVPPTLAARPTAYPAVPAPDYWPTDGWRTAEPAAHGVDPGLLAQMDQEVLTKKLPVDSILVIKDGYLIHESYFQSQEAGYKHDLNSASKSFVATLFGIARDRGLLPDLSAPLLPALGRGDEFAHMDDRKRAITLRDVLTMQTGLEWQDEHLQDYNAMKRTKDWVKYTLDKPMVDQPGRTFNYCNGCSHLLSVLIEKYTGMTAAKFAEANLFKPLGIRTYDWSSDPNGTSEGPSGLRLTPRNFAKLGLLYLQQGRWEGQQVVSSAWVREATTTATSALMGFGYGYQWWTNDDLGMYAALGQRAQNLWVWPEQNMIVVTTANIPDNMLWDPIHNYIVPAVKGR